MPVAPPPDDEWGFWREVQALVSLGEFLVLDALGDAFGWPDADEDALRERLAVAWDDLSKLAGDIAKAAGDQVSPMTTGWPDYAGGGFNHTLSKFAGSEPGGARATATAAHDIAEQVRKYAGEVKYAKEQIVWEVAINLPFYAATFSAGPAGWVAAATARWLISRGTARVVSSLLTNLAARAAASTFPKLLAPMTLRELGLGMVKEAADELLATIPPLINNGLLNTDFGRQQVGQAILGGALGEPVSRVVGKPFGGAGDLVGRGLDRVGAPNWLQRQGSTLVSSFGTNSISSPISSKMANDILSGNWAGLLDIQGYGKSIGDNWLSSGIHGSLRANGVAGANDLSQVATTALGNRFGVDLQSYHPATSPATAGALDPATAAAAAGKGAVASSSATTNAGAASAAPSGASSSHAGGAAQSQAAADGQHQTAGHEQNASAEAPPPRAVHQSAAHHEGTQVRPGDADNNFTASDDSDFGEQDAGSAVQQSLPDAAQGTTAVDQQPNHLVADPARPDARGQHLIDAQSNEQAVPAAPPQNAPTTVHNAPTTVNNAPTTAHNAPAATSVPPAAGAPTSTSAPATAAAATTSGSPSATQVGPVVQTTSGKADASTAEENDSALVDDSTLGTALAEGAPAVSLDLGLDGLQTKNESVPSNGLTTGPSAASGPLGAVAVQAAPAKVTPGAAVQAAPATATAAATALAAVTAANPGSVQPGEAGSAAPVHTKTSSSPSAEDATTTPQGNAGRSLDEAPTTPTGRAPNDGRPHRPEIRVDGGPGQLHTSGWGDNEAVVVSERETVLRVRQLHQPPAAAAIGPLAEALRRVVVDGTLPGYAFFLNAVNSSVFPAEAQVPWHAFARLEKAGAAAIARGLEVDIFFHTNAETKWLEATVQVTDPASGESVTYQRAGIAELADRIRPTVARNANPPAKPPAPVHPKVDPAAYAALEARLAELVRDGHRVTLTITRIARPSADKSPYRYTVEVTDADGNRTPYTSVDLGDLASQVNPPDATGQDASGQQAADQDAEAKQDSKSLADRFLPGFLLVGLEAAKAIVRWDVMRAAGIKGVRLVAVNEYVITTQDGQKYRLVLRIMPLADGIDAEYVSVPGQLPTAWVTLSDRTSTTRIPALMARILAETSVATLKPSAAQLDGTEAGKTLAPDSNPWTDPRFRDTDHGDLAEVRQLTLEHDFGWRGKLRTRQIGRLLARMIESMGLHQDQPDADVRRALIKPDDKTLVERFQDRRSPKDNRPGSRTYFAKAAGTSIWTAVLVGIGAGVATQDLGLAIGAALPAIGTGVVAAFAEFWLDWHKSASKKPAYGADQAEREHQNPGLERLLDGERPPAPPPASEAPRATEQWRYSVRHVGPAAAAWAVAGLLLLAGNPAGVSTATVISAMAAAKMFTERQVDKKKRDDRRIRVDATAKSELANPESVRNQLIRLIEEQQKRLNALDAALKKMLAHGVASDQPTGTDRPAETGTSADVAKVDEQKQKTPSIWTHLLAHLTDNDAAALARWRTAVEPAQDLDWTVLAQQVEWALESFYTTFGSAIGAGLLGATGDKIFTDLEEKIHAAQKTWDHARRDEIRGQALLDALSEPLQNLGQALQELARLAGQAAPDLADRVADRSTQLTPPVPEHGPRPSRLMRFRWYSVQSWLLAIGLAVPVTVAEFVFDIPNQWLGSGIGGAIAALTAAPVAKWLFRQAELNRKDANAELLNKYGVDRDQLNTDAAVGKYLIAQLLEQVAQLTEMLVDWADSADAAGPEAAAARARLAHAISLYNQILGEAREAFPDLGQVSPVNGRRVTGGPNDQIRAGAARAFRRMLREVGDKPLLKARLKALADIVEAVNAVDTHADHPVTGDGTAASLELLQQKLAERIEAYNKLLLKAKIIGGFPMPAISPEVRPDDDGPEPQHRPPDGNAAKLDEFVADGPVQDHAELMRQVVRALQDSGMRWYAGVTWAVVLGDTPAVQITTQDGQLILVKFTVGPVDNSHPAEFRLTGETEYAVVQISEQIKPDDVARAVVHELRELSRLADGRTGPFTPHEQGRLGELLYLEDQLWIAEETHGPDLARRARYHQKMREIMNDLRLEKANRQKLAEQEIMEVLEQYDPGQYTAWSPYTGPIQLDEEWRDFHIVGRHGYGTPANADKFHQNFDLTTLEDLARQVIANSPHPVRKNPVLGTRAYDFDFGPGQVMGSLGQTKVRVWIDPDGNVKTVHPVKN